MSLHHAYQCRAYKCLRDCFRRQNMLYKCIFTEHGRPVIDLAALSMDYMRRFNIWAHAVADEEGFIDVLMLRLMRLDG